MRLTIINQFYAPDLAPTGRLAAALANHRAGLGDDVSVVTSYGGYVPQSQLATGSGRVNPRVYRLWTPRAGKASPLARLADYAAFTLLAGWRMLTMPKQDVIVSLTTPPFVAWTAVLHRAIHPGTAVILWNMDCYPEIMERTGVIQRKGIASRLLRWLNRSLFKQLTSVVALDRAMLDLLRSSYGRHDGGPSWHVIPNWEPRAMYPSDLSPLPWSGIDQLGLQGRFVILYTGNAGFGHSFESVIQAAEKLDGEPFSWVFVGGGDKFAWLADQAATRRLNHLHLVDYVADDALPSVLASAGCALITMNENAMGVVSPSKMHACLAMGLPILYIGPPGGNVDDAIQRYELGASLRHEDVDGVVTFLRELAEDSEKRRQLGERARAAFEDAYSDVKALPQFDSVIETALHTSD